MARRVADEIRCPEWILGGGGGRRCRPKQPPGSPSFWLLDFASCDIKKSGKSMFTCFPIRVDMGSKVSASKSMTNRPHTAHTSSHPSVSASSGILNLPNRAGFPVPASGKHSHSLTTPGTSSRT